MSTEMIGLTPLIQVFDMVASLHCYRDLLGFEIVLASPEVETPEGRFSHWMWLRRGSADLMLNTAYDSGERPALRDEQRWRGHQDTGLFITCSDVDALYAELSARGVKAARPVVATYGMKYFEVRDPDGYGLNFQTREAADGRPPSTLPISA